ncbi:hypothetical protein BJ742DRAFT_715550 [Cladochytrium replicatum]|nr:hypothetical protein BJ742DRAFT_715550 [Cladochytrium replicatum]
MAETAAATIPAQVQKRLDALKNLQDKHTELEAKFREEILALDRKYLALNQPLYDRRAEIIAGKSEPSDEESTRKPEKKDDEDGDADVQATPLPAFDENTAGVPQFWLTVLKNHPQIAEQITERDEEALNALTDIKVAFLENNPGFKLTFSFSDNSFFTDSELTKTYFLLSSPDVTYGDFVYDHAEGCTINWKEGQDLSVKVEIKKQRHKGTNKTRTVKKTVPAETFFSFFKPPKAPTDSDNVEEDELQEIEEKLEFDYELGEIIKEKLIPRAIDWFTGKALEYEEGEFDDEDFDIDDEGGDDDDDEDDDDEVG